MKQYDPEIYYKQGWLCISFAENIGESYER